MKKWVPLSFLCLGLSIFAQEPTKITGISGSANVAGDVSPNQAKAQALNNAKINALKKAGIAEHINSYQLLFTSQQRNDYSQFFTSDIQTEIQGAVKSFEVTNEKLYCKSEFEIVYDVTIDAEVVKYETKPDITFDCQVEGIKGLYANDENLTFTMKTSQACYLTIFNITDNDAFVLFPNAYEKQFKCTPHEWVQFPKGEIDYAMHTDSKLESNRLIFVFTKLQIPYMKMDKEQITLRENIFSWIYSIPPDQRKVAYFSFTIQK